MKIFRYLVRNVGDKGLLTDMTSLCAGPPGSALIMSRLNYHIVFNVRISCSQIGDDHFLIDLLYAVFKVLVGTCSERRN
jgi:hypothetical protein